MRFYLENVCVQDPEVADMMADMVEQADAVLVLAPETGQLLLRLTRQVESATTLLLGPGSDWVAIRSWYSWNTMPTDF